MTTGVACPVPILQFFDNAGNPAIGGTVLTQVGGINTATFSDINLTVPLPNPIPLNSRGEVSTAAGASAQLFLQPNVAYTFTLFDANGNQLNQAIYVNGTQVTAQQIGQAIFPQSAAEIAANVTPTNYTYIWGDVRRYGALLNGGDDTGAMVQACAVGGHITIPGNMSMSSVSLTALPNTAIEILSGTTIECTNAAQITITGISACNVFHSTDVSNVTLLNVNCTGNGGSSGTIPTGYFWYALFTAGATQNATNINVLGTVLTNFGGLYWIYFDNTAGTSFNVNNITIDGCQFFSKSGNAQPAALLITGTASVFGFSGSNTVTSIYTIEDVYVRNCFADGTHLKNFLFFWSGTARCRAYNNNLVGFGTGGEFSDDTGCYAMAAYDFSHGAALPPDDIEFYNNIVEGVRDVGIYCAGPNPPNTFTNRITCHGNRFANQTSTVNTTLLKGGIVFNSIYLATASDNVFYNCAFGLSIGQADGTGSVNWAIDNVAEAIPNSGYGMWLTSTFGGAAPKIVVDGFHCEKANAATNTTAIKVQASATVGINNIDLLNLDIEGVNTGVLFFAADSSVPALGNVRIANVRMNGITGTNLEFDSCTNTSQNTVIENVTFSNMQAGAVGLNLLAMVNVTVRNVLFEGMSSGATFCWYSAGTQGRLAGMQFQNVAGGNRYPAGSHRLGVDTPNWTGNDNDYVQYLDPTVTGSGGFGTANQKQWQAGWTYDRLNSAWAPDVRLTGA